jgi:WXG100 family type VII secretion target
MSDIIKMDYGLMDEMARGFDESTQTLEAVQKQVSSIAQELQDGGLLGQAGEAFVDALSTRLAPAIARLEEKFTELRQDIVAAKQDMADADSTSVSYY